MSKLRKLKAFWVSENTIADLLNGDVVIVNDDLPDDFKIAFIREDAQSFGFLLFGESEAFEEVPLGECAPKGAFVLEARK